MMIGWRCVLTCLVMIAGCAAPLAPLAPVAPPPTDNPVSIKSTPPVIMTLRFTPGRPPPEMLPMKPGEDAMHTGDYSCTAVLQADVVSAGPDGRRVELRIKGVEVTVGLRSVLWLPDNVSRKLSEHMAGHHRIDETLYARGWGVASRVARGRIGSVHAARGTSDAELEAVVNSVCDSICSEYMNNVQVVANRIHERYSELTDMGRNSVPPDVALRRAFEESGVPYDPDVLMAAAELGEQG